MTGQRITRADVERRLELVKSTAEREGLVVIDHTGATFDSLYIQGWYGTYQLLGCQAGETGVSYTPPPRGLREISTFLSGMYDGIDAARHNRKMSD